MVNPDGPTLDPGNLTTPEDMVRNVVAILEQYVEPWDAERIAHKAVAILISSGHVIEWGMNADGDPLYEARAHIVFAL